MQLSMVGNQCGPSTLSGYSSWRTDKLTGGDEAKKLEFWRAQVWNKTREGHATKALKSSLVANTRQKARKEATRRPTTAKPAPKPVLRLMQASAMHKLIT